MRSLRALPVSTASSDVLDVMRQEPRAFTRREVSALSSPSRARTAIERGSIVRLLPNLYVAAEHQYSFLAMADAALAWAGDGAALAGRSALFARGLLDAPPADVTLTVPHGRHLSPPAWLALRQVSYRVPYELVHGMAAATAAYAIAQGYGELTRADQTDVIFGGVARGLVTARQLRQALHAVPRIRDRRRLTSRIEAVERGAESWLEELSLRQVFTGVDFATFLRQHRISGRLGPYRLDMYDPFTRTAIEIDGATWHRGDKQRQRDIARDADLATLDIVTVRFSTRDLVDNPDWCREVVRSVLAARRQRTAD